MRVALFLGSLAPLIAVLASCTLLTSTDGLSQPNSDAGMSTKQDAASSSGSVNEGGSITDGGGLQPSDGGRSAAYRAAVMADAPAAYFRLDDVTSGGCVDEVAGSRFTCAYGASGVTRGVDGVASSAAVRVTKDATVSIAADTIDFNQPFTFELWLELDAPAPSTGIVSAMTNLTNTTRIGFTAFLFDQGGAFRTEMWNVDFQTYTLAANPPTAAAWHHVVIEHDVSKDFTYVDGAPSSGGFPYGDAGDPRVKVPLVFTGFAGRIDEVAWYDHVLGPARVLAHFGLN